MHQLILMVNSATDVQRKHLTLYLIKHFSNPIEWIEHQLIHQLNIINWLINLDSKLWYRRARVNIIMFNPQSDWMIKAPIKSSIKH